MAGFKLSELIDHSPDRVFAFMTDSANAPRISSSVKEQVKLTDGPLGVGTRLRETRLMQGKEAQAELEVFAYKPPESFGVSNEQEGFKVTYQYTLTPDKDGTRIDLECTVKGSGAKKLMEGMVAGILKKEDGEHLRQLKSAMEG